MNAWKKSTVPNLIKNAITGVYYARFRTLVNGKSRQLWRSLKTDDITLAKELLLDVMQKAKEESIAEAHAVFHTVGDAVEVLRAQNWSLSARDVKPRTIEFYSDRVRSLYKSWPGLDTTPLRQVTTQQCIRWANTFNGSAATFNGDLLVFRLIIKLALENGSLKVDPLAGVRRKEIISKKPELPSKQQFADMLRVMRCSQHSTAQASYDLVRIMAFSGVRLGEAHGLRWRDVDFSKSQLRIEHQLSKDGSGLVTPKNGEERVVQMNAALKEALLEIHNRAAQAGRGGAFERLTSIETCQETLDHASTVVGCARITHHGLRHFFITSCVESGIDFKTIAVWVGHKDGGILIGKTYSHLRSEHSQLMAERVNFDAPDNVVELDRKAVGQ